MKSILGLMLIFVFGGCTLLFNRGDGHRGPKSDHFDGERFFNPGSFTQKSFFEFLKWQLSSDRKAWPKWQDNKHTPEIVKEIAKEIGKNEIVLTFVNHATMLIQLHDINILIDPIWSERASPYQNLGPKRIREPGVPFDQLPQIHAVLVSHNHYDHLDLPTLQKLAVKHQAVFLVALGDAEILKKAGIENVQELDWWQKHHLSSAVAATFTPALHWSGRGLSDRFRSLWGGFVVQTDNLKIYYAGDTGYSDHFKRIREKMGPIQMALLPIGAYEPRWFMTQSHINPEEAVRAHLDLGASVSLGVHFGTFQLTDEALEAPVLELAAAKVKYQIADDKFLVLGEGQTQRFTFP